MRALLMAAVQWNEFSVIFVGLYPEVKDLNDPRRVVSSIRFVALLTIV